MPELAEVEYYRKRWNPAFGQRILAVHTHPAAKVFRGSPVRAWAAALRGQTLLGSEAAAKQMLFRFSGQHWLGLHLGMSGSLSRQNPEYRPGRHDHLVLATERDLLVFTDPRMFGRVRHWQGPEAPAEWRALPPPLLSEQFTPEALVTYFARRRASPVKALLLDQGRFPGVGNWMADEILWRAGLHPRRKGGDLSREEIGRLHAECRWVAREALATIGETMEDPPASWLFPHRWADGGTCPRSGVKLERATIGGRTTCWSPALQPITPKMTRSRGPKGS